MVGQLLLEDEYVINVKVRRPIDGSCPPPPTFTVACHDAKHMEREVKDDHGRRVNFHPNSKLPLPSSDYIGSFTIGPDMGENSAYKENFPKSIGWKKPAMPPQDLWDSRKHTSVTLKPGGRKIYDCNQSEAISLKEAPDCGSLKELPLVKVYGEDSNLLATNVFQPPEKKEEPKPSQKGTLYVERIADHCKSTSGELYVPPVQQEKLKDKKCELTAMKGNSRRTESERIRAKMCKKSFSPIVQKQVVQARENLSSILENEVANDLNKPTESYPALLSLPYNVQKERSPPTRPLTFPAPQPCIKHPCPRRNELDQCVHLSQSCTLFPTSPAFNAPRQSFNFLPSRSGSSTSLPPDSNLEDCQPHYSSVFPGTSSQLEPSYSFSYYDECDLESTDDEQFIKPAFFRAPNSLKSPSPVVRTEMPPSQSQAHRNLQHQPQLKKNVYPRSSSPMTPFEIQYSASDHHLSQRSDVSPLPESYFEQCYSDGDYTTSYVSDTSSPERNSFSPYYGRERNPWNNSPMEFSMTQPTGQHLTSNIEKPHKMKDGPFFSKEKVYYSPSNLKSKSLADLDHQKLKPQQRIRFASPSVVEMNSNEHYSNKTPWSSTCNRARRVEKSTERAPVLAHRSGGSKSRQTIFGAPDQLAQTHHLPPTRTFFPKDVYSHHLAASRDLLQGDRSGSSARSAGLPLTSQPVADPTLRNKTLGSRGELQESQFSSQDPIRPHRTDPSHRPHRTDPSHRPHRIDSRPQSDPRTSDPTMLATEQPLGLRPGPHHYGSSDEQESLELESRAEKYLFQGRYSPTDSSHDQQSRSYEPLDRRFPNGFPDFNHKFKNNSNNYFRNNISRDAEFERKVDNYGFDAGYSSEKSPEEDQAPSGFDIETLSSREQTASPCHGDYTDGQTDDQTEEEQQQSLVLQMIDDGQELSTSSLMNAFPFINEGSLFDVTLEKNSRGLGLALTGGRETRGQHAGLIRIKKLYPQMPAWLCGQLRLGDILLEANGVPLSGLSSHEALEELRTTRTSSVHLVLCRPPAGTFEDDLSASPVPAAAAGCPGVVTSSLMGHQLGPSDQLQVPSPLSVCGEFEVTLAKVKGSLGFTLRKRDNSVLGHTIRTLVRDPALSDGRIKPGDKILSVNNRDLCGLSHEEAIAFLRTTPDVVTIRLYRDVTQTPVSPLSPTEPEHSILNPKPLRQEARDMLSDLALRKRSSPTSNSPGLDGTHSPSPGNPRRRRLHKTPTPDVAKPNNLVDKFDLLVQGIEEDPFSMTESPSGFGNTDNASLTNRDSCTSTLSANSTVVSRNASTASTGTNSLSEASETRRRRPNFLDLDSRQSCSRKVQFTPPHEIGDSFPSPNDEEEDNYLESIGSVDSAPACSNAQSVSPAFTHSQPGYQSVNFGGTHDHARLTGTSSDFTLSSHLQQDSDVGRQKTGLMKWKGTYMGQENDCEDGGELRKDSDNANSGHGKSLRKKEVTITLHRGWNSRLGFSLKAVDGVTRVVAVYAGCVAAKDGRLKVGDEIISVNGDDVSEWRTEDVIDLLRKTHGNIELRVVQPAF